MIATPKITYRQYGGKASIAKWIVSHFPEHRTYLEPLCGSAAVLLAKPRSFVEIINDLDGAVMGMWQAIKSQPEQLAALLWATPYTAANWREQPVGDIDQAVLLMAQGAQFYCGNGNSSTWSLDKCPAPHKPKAEVWADWFRRVLPAANRMRGVAATCTKTPWSPSSGSTVTPKPFCTWTHRTGATKTSTATASTTRRWSSC